MYISIQPAEATSVMYKSSVSEKPQNPKKRTILVLKGGWMGVRPKLFFFIELSPNQIF